MSMAPVEILGHRKEGNRGNDVNYPPKRRGKTRVNTRQQHVLHCRDRCIDLNCDLMGVSESLLCAVVARYLT